MPTSTSIQGHHPNRVLPNLMTHCNYSTTPPSFDCIKYAYNHYEPIPLYYEPIPLNNEQYRIYDVAAFHQYPIYDVAAFHPDSQSINTLSRDNISLIQGHHPNKVEDQSINALSRDNISPIQGHHPNRVLPNLMTHCNYSTTAPYFDCSTYEQKVHMRRAYLLTLRDSCDIGTRENNKVQVSPIKASRKNVLEENNTTDTDDIVKDFIHTKDLNIEFSPNPDPHTFKEELKTKYQGTLEMTSRFPNGTVFMEEGDDGGNSNHYNVADDVENPGHISMNKSTCDNDDICNNCNAEEDCCISDDSSEDDRNEDDNVHDDCISECGSENMKSKPLTIEHYFKMPPEEKTYWEKKGDDLNIASKNCYPQNVEAFTRLHDFDQMDQLVYHDEEEHQEELMEHDCHRITQKTTKNYIMQKVNTAFERKRAQTIRDSVLYGQTPSLATQN